MYTNMSSTSLIARLHDKEYRDSFASSLINSTIAFQIRALRKNENLDQAGFGALVGMKQTAISRLENPDYGNLSVNTLKRIAKALDVGLIVRFAPFSELARWRLFMSQQDMTPSTFSNDRGLYALDRTFCDSTHRMVMHPRNTKGWTSLQMRFDFDASVPFQNLESHATAQYFVKAA